MTLRARRILAIAGCLGLLIASLAWLRILDLRRAIGANTVVYGWDHPKPGQVVQYRPGRSIQLEGRVGWLTRTVEVYDAPQGTRQVPFDGWTKLPDATLRGRFRGSMDLAPGWHRLLVRTSGFTGWQAGPVCEVGVGEVFIVAGQSNAVGGSLTLNLAQEPGVRKGELLFDDSLLWSPCVDPQSRLSRGSHWPLVGDQLTRRLGRPIGFINVGVGSSGIREWLPGTALFRKLEAALDATAPHGVRAILWQQGEDDRKLSADVYYTHLKSIIRATRTITQAP